MHPYMRGYVEALTAPLGGEPSASAVADDLTAVAHLVSRTNELAVVLTDFGVPSVARRAVLQDLLSSRVHPVALRIVLRAVATERADELPTVLHDLYEYVRHLLGLGMEEVRAEEPIAGRSAWRSYASGYADAVLEEVVSSSELEEIEEEVFRFARIVEANPGLGRALSDPGRSVDDRQRVVDGLLTGKVRPMTVRLVHVTLEGHVRDVVAALDWLVEQVAQARGWRVARVHTALPVGADEQRSMAEALQRLTDRPVELLVIDQPDLLGGAVVEVGDLLVDASARHRLEQLREHLIRPERATRGAMTDG